MKSRLLTTMTLILIAMMALPVLSNSTVHADGDEELPVVVPFEGYVQYVGADYAVIDGYVVYADSAFDPTSLAVGDYVSGVGTMNDDGSLTATSLEVDPSQPAPEDPEPGEVITVVGPITITDDYIMVGDYVIAPAGAFNPSTLEDGDIVIITGLLLNEDTVQATSIFVVGDQADEEDDECDTDGDTDGDTTIDDDGDEDCDQQDDEDDGEDNQDTGVCSNLNPVGETLASEYGVEEDTILEWRCDGYGYGEIARALALADAAGEDADDILSRRADGEGWGNILKDYDISPSELAPGRAISNGKNKNKNNDDDDDGENLRGNGRGNNGRGPKDNNGRGNPHNDD